MAEFVTTILTPAEENKFLPDFIKIQRRIAASGAFHSLSQTLLRLVSPGVPDIYQGAELWEFSMVDPDNRRPVDFTLCETLLAELTATSLSRLLQTWQSGAIKQYVIQKTLTWRRDHPDVFRDGEYIPLQTGGQHADRALAFARHSGMSWVVACVPRFPSPLSRALKPPLGKHAWADTELCFPPTAPRHWSNILTGENLEVPGTGHAALADILGRFPVALLTALPD